jgi:hypothetical protein
MPKTISVHDSRYGKTATGDWPLYTVAVRHIVALTETKTGDNTLRLISGGDLKISATDVERVKAAMDGQD